MEASYEKNGTLDGAATEYWKIIRRRSHVDEDFQKTIALTDMSKEAENDWGAYSGGKLIDATLYNIVVSADVNLWRMGFVIYGLMPLACYGPVD